MNNTFYVGTYTDYPPAQSGRRESVYCARLDPETGKAEIVAAFACGPNPSFLAFHPNGRGLYAVNELAEGGASALLMEAGRMRLLNYQFVQGADPCYLSIDPTGAWLVVACYSSGSLAVLPIQSDGRLGALVERIQHTGSGPNPNQEKAHVHSAVFDPSGSFLLSADLGMDQVFVYQLDPRSGHLIANDPPGLDLPRGAGPRHIVFHPDGRRVYISNELNSTVTVCAWDAELGRLEPLQTLSTLPVGFRGNNQVADIHFSPAGDVLYVSNRGDNSLAAFSVSKESGLLELIGIYPCGGDWPRNFAIHPGGGWLLVANQKSQNVSILKIETGGALSLSGELSVPAPVFVMFAA